MGSPKPRHVPTIRLPFLTFDCTLSIALKRLWTEQRWAAISEIQGSYELISARQIALGYIQTELLNAAAVHTLSDIPVVIGISDKESIETSAFEVLSISASSANVIFSDASSLQRLLRGPSDCFCEREAHEYEHEEWHEISPICRYCPPLSRIKCLRRRLC